MILEQTNNAAKLNKERMNEVQSTPSALAESVTPGVMDIE